VALPTTAQRCQIWLGAIDGEVALLTATQRWRVRPGAMENGLAPSVLA
jgi:hypothetical protein